MIIRPVPTGEPISTGVLTAIATLFNLFGIFGGGLSGAVKQAIQALADNLSAAIAKAVKFAWGIGSFAGKIIGVLNHIYERIIKPVLARIDAIRRKLLDWYEKILKPYYDQIVRIRKAILDIYDKFFRPWIDMISAVRAFLAPFRVFGLKFAQRLDAYLADLQAKIYAPIQYLLERTAGHDRWLNFILSAQYMLQRPLWQRTMAANPRVVVDTIVNSMLDPYEAAAPAPPAARPAPMSVSVAVSELDLAVRQNAGPLAAEVEAGVAGLRGLLAGGGL